MTGYRSDAADRLCEVLLQLKTKEECYALLEDLCTVREVKDLSQRLQVAALLEQGNSCKSVAAETGVSATTVSRVHSCMEYGAGGYRRALRRLRGEEETE